MTAEAIRVAVHAAEAVTDASRFNVHFDNWERTATVRSPRARSREATTSAQFHFPPELVPTFAHPLVADCGWQTQSRLLVHALYQYLHFTSELEDLAVIPVAMDLSRACAGFDVPGHARLDAYKIVTDEAWHAQFSADLIHQVAQDTGEPQPVLGQPMFVERLRQVSDHTRLPALDRLLFAVVSETLVSSILAEIPHDERLPRQVRETVADHALDEGRHHAYFREVLRHLWAALSRGERAAVGPWLPAIIFAFLEPDYRAQSQSLAALGLSQEQREAVLLEAYPRSAVVAQVARAARPTIRYFTEVGALEDPATADAFAVLGAS